MHLKTVVFGVVLALLGTILYFSGVSMTNNILRPADLIAGSNLVVVGIFLILTGSLLLAAQIYRGN